MALTGQLGVKRGEDTDRGILVTASKCRQYGACMAPSVSDFGQIRKNWIFATKTNSFRVSFCEGVPSHWTPSPPFLGFSCIGHT